MRQVGNNNKIRPISNIAEVITSLRGKGTAHPGAGSKKIVLCHGVFDLWHIGHIRYFQGAKKLGDVLAVTVTPDRYVTHQR